MTDLFSPDMNAGDVNQISMLGLAHIGDAVYELLVRSYLCTRGYKKVTELHDRTVSFVNAAAQAKAVDIILPLLSEDELAVLRRGRNTKVSSVPQNSTTKEYRMATALEALFGWLYLQGMGERINLLFSAITEAYHGT